MKNRKQLNHFVCSNRIGVDVPGKYKIALDTDAAEFGGFNRLDRNTEFFTSPDGWGNRRNSLMVLNFISSS